jgi:hypothetical protein
LLVVVFSAGGDGVVNPLEPGVIANGHVLPRDMKSYSGLKVTWAKSRHSKIDDAEIDGASCAVAKTCI